MGVRPRVLVGVAAVVAGDTVLGAATNGPKWTMVAADLNHRHRDHGLRQRPQDRRRVVGPGVGDRRVFTMDSAGNVIDKNLRLPGHLEDLSGDRVMFVNDDGAVEV